MTTRTCPLRDSQQRPIDYLRVSVTDRCNLRCVYCMPEEGVAPCDHESVLRYEEIARLVRVAADMGISHVRLTGGEPLARRGFVDLVRMVAETPGIEDVSMTSNGTLLAEWAQELAAAGLERVNVSLDTLDAEHYHAITRRGQLADVLAGIEAARQAGLNPVKINVVVVRGMNDDQVVAFAERARDLGWHVRFIEVMPLGQGVEQSREHYVSSEETRQRIEAALGAMSPAELRGSGPARYWRLPGSEGTIGFISAISDHFCASCNRLRLTADGRLMPCLFSDLAIPIREPLRAGASDMELQQVFQQAIGMKPRGHRIAEDVLPENRLMSRVGG